MARNVQIIPAQTELRQKAVNSTTGVDIALTPTELDKLEAVIQESKDEFVIEAADLLKRLRMTLGRARKNREDADAFVQIARDVAYDIKALGGTFNYQLMTAIAKSLHDFLDGREVLTGKQYDLVGLHADMLYLVLSRHMQGPGGPTEQQIVLALKEGARRFA